MDSSYAFRDVSRSLHLSQYVNWILLSSELPMEQMHNIVITDSKFNELQQNVCFIFKIEKNKMPLLNIISNDLRSFSIRFCDGGPLLKRKRTAV